MAVEYTGLDVSWLAAEDLSSDQYHFVVLDSTTGTVRRPDSATEIVLGVLQNTPKSGKDAVVRLMGTTKVCVNALLAIGKLVKSEYVGATDAGKAEDAGGLMHMARGVVLLASAAEDDLATIFLFGPNPLFTSTLVNKVTVTDYTTADVVNFTAASLLGGLITRDPNGGARADTLDTAANIVAAIPQCAVGSAVKFTIINTADNAETITVTTNTGLTLSGIMTIDQKYQRDFLAIVTNVGTPAVTVYDMGATQHTP